MIQLKYKSLKVIVLLLFQLFYLSITYGHEIKIHGKVIADITKLPLEEATVKPKNYQYPINEITANAVDLAAVIQSKYGGKDDINTKMGLVKIVSKQVVV